MRKFKNKDIIDSFNSAIEGFLFVVKTQRNMRIHFLLAVFVVLLGIYLNFSRMELIMLLFAAGLVLITEMINTAMELTINYVEPEHADWVKIVKDITAGAVLTSSIIAFIVGYLLFFRNNIIYRIFQRGVLRLGQSDWHISFFIVIVIVGVVIVSKAIFHRGRPLRGGMPSGHAAIAFAVWVLVVLLSKDMLLAFMVFVLSFMIAQSRISRNYHTAWEVLLGSFLGIFITLFLYSMLAGQP
jgi:diacylglycerol kinase (ATP)